jgi:hypothetical protein
MGLKQKQHEDEEKIVMTNDNFKKLFTFSA